MNAFLKYKNDEGFTTGLCYSTKQEYINNAYEFALSGFCDCFVANDVLDSYPRQYTITITKDEVVAMKTAIRLLNDSESDFADQALYHLENIVNRL